MGRQPTDLTKIAREAAAEVKVLIMTEPLAGIIHDGQLVDLEEVGGIGVKDRFQYGWRFDSEAKIADFLTPYLVEAEQRALADVSTRALIDELRSRHSIFFCCGMPKSRDGEDYSHRSHWEGQDFYQVKGYVDVRLLELMQDRLDEEDGEGDGNDDEDAKTKTE